MNYIIDLISGEGGTIVVNELYHRFIGSEFFIASVINTDDDILKTLGYKNYDAVITRDNITDL